MSSVTTPDFDFIVLGAGSGGVAASRRAALHGARVAIVEGRGVGGTCVLRGCVPKKLLMYAAQFADDFAQARGYGWQLDAPSFLMARWAAAKAAETARLEGVYRDMLRDGHVSLIEGWARIEGPGQVRVGDKLTTARHILIATGSAPITDSVPGIETCATSDDLLDLQALPPAAAVIGGGYIAIEFASMLARLGVQVSLFYRAELPLRGFDGMLRSAAAASLTSAGVSLHPGQAPVSVSRHAAGVAMYFADGSVREFPWALNATGRRPNTQGLGLETLDITVDKQHAVPVDDAMCTTAPNVYAIGDVTNRMNLTPVAIAEGRALADTLFGAAPRKVDLSLVTSAVFTLPPLASIGPSEETLAASGRAVHVYESDFRPMKQAFIGGRERTRMKMLVDAHTDRVLAIHMAGTDAPEIVQSLAVAMSAGASKAHFDRTMAVHPTSAEEFVLMRKPARQHNTGVS